MQTLGAAAFGKKARLQMKRCLTVKPVAIAIIELCLSESIS